MRQGLVHDQLPIIYHLLLSNSGLQQLLLIRPFSAGLKSPFHPGLTPWRACATPSPLARPCRWSSLGHSGIFSGFIFVALFCTFARFSPHILFQGARGQQLGPAGNQGSSQHSEAATWDPNLMGWTLQPAPGPCCPFPPKHRLAAPSCTSAPALERLLSLCTCKAHLGMKSLRVCKKPTPTPSNPPCPAMPWFPP